MYYYYSFSYFISSWMMKKVYFIGLWRFLYGCEWYLPVDVHSVVGVRCQCSLHFTWMSSMCLCPITPREPTSAGVRDKQSPLRNIYTQSFSTKCNRVVLCNRAEVSRSVLCQRFETQKSFASLSFVNLFAIGTAVKFHLDSVSHSFHITSCQFKCIKGK